MQGLGVPSIDPVHDAEADLVAGVLDTKEAAATLSQQGNLHLHGHQAGGDVPGGEGGRKDGRRGRRNGRLRLTGGCRSGRR